MLRHVCLLGYGPAALVLRIYAHKVVARHCWCVQALIAMVHKHVKAFALLIASHIVAWACYKAVPSTYQDITTLQCNLGCTVSWSEETVALTWCADSCVQFECCEIPTFA